MSVENVFNSPAKRLKQKKLTQTFDMVISGIRQLNLGDEGDAMTKSLVKHYTTRRLEIDQEVDEDADIHTKVIQRRNKKSKNGIEGTELLGAIDTKEEKAAAAPAKPLTKAEQLKANAAKKGKSGDVDDLSA